MSPNADAPYLLGVARRDITFLKRGVGLLGWGDFFNKAYGVESRLYARAYVCADAKDPAKKMAWVIADFCFCTQLLKLEVSSILEKQYSNLGLNDQNLMIAGTHTHSAPGGFSESILYNIPNRGVVPEIFETYVAGIVEAIVDAASHMVPGRIQLSKGRFADSVPVAFNRSIAAYNRNPEVDPKLTEAEAHLGVDREMTLLRFENAAGELLGVYNWFGVHATCIKRNHEVISSDNKGYASEYVEHVLGDEKRAKAPIVGFAQSTAGDVTPNYRKHRGILETLGRSRNSFKNRDHSGRMQADLALKLIESGTSEELSGLDFVTAYHDMGKISVDPEFSAGVVHARTGPGALGTGFVRGTREGRGAPVIVAWIVWLVVWLMGRKDSDVQGPKMMFIETVEKRWLGFQNIEKVPIPSWVHPFLRLLRSLRKNAVLRRIPLVPQKIPTQVFRLGSLAVVVLPAEPTTIVGARIRSQVMRELGPLGVKHVVTAGYANAYTGYITTYEEFQEQAYEGAHNLFGQWTAAAYQTILEPMLQHLANGGKKTRERFPQECEAPERLNWNELVLVRGRGR